MASGSLRHQGNPLAEGACQLAVLQSRASSDSFDRTLADHGFAPLKASGLEVLQVNVGRLCNMTCAHCHVDAGPDRREIMSRETAEACIAALELSSFHTLDLTGGAPEMNPHFRWMVSEARRLGRHVTDRCNLTILLAAGHEQLPEFLADHDVEIVASLPCYLEANVDAQRGNRAFSRSLVALKRLNQLGYGQPESGRILTLVYNPVGPALPPPQAELETAYRRELDRRYGIVFTRLHTITNMPLGRFLDHLLRTGQYDEYRQRLIDAFNPDTVEGVMCRTTLSVDWEGRLYDCDFNQMLDVPLAEGSPQTIHDFNAQLLSDRPIKTGPHCFGCTAGAGSGCRGAIRN